VFNNPALVGEETKIKNDFTAVLKLGEKNRRENKWA